jgi:tetratricopeptide (TPR) repeat protein
MITIHCTRDLIDKLHLREPTEQATPRPRLEGEPGVESPTATPRNAGKAAAPRTGGAPTPPAEAGEAAPRNDGATAAPAKGGEATAAKCERTAPVLGDWYARRADIDGRQMVVFVNERSLLSVAVSFTPMAALLDRFRSRVGRLLSALDIPPPSIAGELAAMGEVALARTADRSLVSSMNRICVDMTQFLDFTRTGGSAEIADAERYVARTAYKTIGYLSPEVAARAYLEGDEDLIGRLEETRRRAKTPIPPGRRRQSPDRDIAHEDLYMIACGEHEFAFFFPRLTPDVDDRFGAALELYEAGDLWHAQRELRRLIREFPEFIDAHHHLALMQEERGEVDAAYRRWKLAVGIALSRMPSQFERGRDRLPWYDLNNRPFLRAYHGLALQYLKRGRLREAIDVLEHLLDLNPDDHQGVRALLVNAFLAGDFAARALGICDRFPDDAVIEVLYGRALALYRLGRWDEADRALGLAVDAAPLVAEALLAESFEELDMSDASRDGDAEQFEAAEYAVYCGPLWFATPDAVEWLDEFLSSREAVEEEAEAPPDWPESGTGPVIPPGPGGDTVH